MESRSEPAMTVNPFWESMPIRAGMSCAPTPTFAFGICVHVAPLDDVKTPEPVTKMNSDPVEDNLIGRTADWPNTPGWVTQSNPFDDVAASLI